MTEKTVKYNSDLLKSTGLIQESILLFSLYEKGISKPDFIKRAIESNILVKNNDNRIKDIINHAFYRRYFTNGEDIALALKLLHGNYIGLDVFTQIIFVYTCRANRILFDFMIFIMDEYYLNKATTLPSKAAIDFIDEAIKDGRIEKAWSDSTKRKVSEHINACLIDFRITDRQKRFLPFFLHDYVANFLIHELHFAGFTEQSIINSEDWRLFGLKENDVARLIERLSFQDHFIFQSSGEIVRISWKYNNILEFINGTTRPKI
jgi:hypothetical protein